VAYRHGGKPKTIRLGPYPEVTLAAAREHLIRIKAQLRTGENPITARKRAARGSISFAQATMDYFSGGRQDISTSYLGNALHVLEMHIFPDIGKKWIGEITCDDLLISLQRMPTRS
jgi:hypothetical protein